MRVLVIVNVFVPDRGAAGAVYSDLCFALAEQGCDVTVRCPVPYFPEWEDKTGRNGFGIWRYTERKAKIERYGVWLPKNPRSAVQRMLFEASLFLSLARSLPRSKDYDVVLTFVPHVANQAFGWLVKRVYGKPLWLNVQDIASDAAQATGVTKGPLGRLLSWVEHKAYNAADVWNSISPVMIDRLRGLRRHGQPILFLPNWVDLDLLTELRKRPEKESRQPGEPLRLLYAGNIAGKLNIQQFCEVLQRSDAPFEFRIFGAGGAAQSLRDWVEKTADPRFSIGPFLGAEALAEQLHWAEMYIVTEVSGAGGSFFPSKLVTGMTSGTPILAVCDTTSPLGREMQEAKPGIDYRWAEIDRIPDLIRELVRDRGRLRTWQENARTRGRSYDRDAIIGRFRENLERLAKAEKIESD